MLLMLNYTQCSEFAVALQDLKTTIMDGWVGGWVVEDFTDNEKRWVAYLKTGYVVVQLPSTFRGAGWIQRRSVF